jgi:amino acid transporter
MNTGMNQIDNVNNLITRLATLGDVIVYLLVALAVIFVVYNIVIYLIKGDDPATKGKAGLNILWGIAGLAIIVSLWGLVNILLNTFGTNTNPPVQLPNANFVSGTQNNP